MRRGAHGNNPITLGLLLKSSALLKQVGADDDSIVDVRMVHLVEAYRVAWQIHRLKTSREIATEYPTPFIYSPIFLCNNLFRLLDIYQQRCGWAHPLEDNISEVDITPTELLEYGYVLKECYPLLFLECSKGYGVRPPPPIYIQPIICKQNRLLILHNAPDHIKASLLMGMTTCATNLGWFDEARSYILKTKPLLEQTPRDKKEEYDFRQLTAYVRLLHAESTSPPPSPRVSNWHIFISLFSIKRDFVRRENIEVEGTRNSFQ